MKFIRAILRFRLWIIFADNPKFKLGCSRLVKYFIQIFILFIESTSTCQIKVLAINMISLSLLTEPLLPKMIYRSKAHVQLSFPSSSYNKKQWSFWINYFWGQTLEPQIDPQILFTLIGFDLRMILQILRNELKTKEKIFIGTYTLSYNLNFYK